MSYDNGTSVGYDQISANHEYGSYKDYDRESFKLNKSMPNNELFSNIIAGAGDNIFEKNDRTSHRVKSSGKYNSVYDYLNDHARTISPHEKELRKIKKKLHEYKIKNEFMFIFIICLFIIVILQYSMHIVPSHLPAYWNSYPMSSTNRSYNPAYTPTHQPIQSVESPTVNV
jgi:hypothetical protein